MSSAIATIRWQKKSSSSYYYARIRKEYQNNFNVGDVVKISLLHPAIKEKTIEKPKETTKETMEKVEEEDFNEVNNSLETKKGLNFMYNPTKKQGGNKEEYT